MSNKNKFYTNNQNRVVKQEKKKLKLSQWIVLILMIFWTVGSCLSVYLVFDNRKVETVSAAESTESNSNIIRTPVYYPQENRSISGVTIDWLFPEVFRVGSMMAQSDTVEFYLLAVMLQAGSYSFVAEEHTGVATDVVTFSVVDYEGSFIPNGEFFTFVLEERTYTYLKISVDKDKFANISLKLYQNIDTTDIYNQGYENGKNDGLSEGEDIGYENGYEQGFEDSTEEFTYGIFKGATLSGTIGFSDNTQQSFENIIPNYINNGVSMQPLYDYITNTYTFENVENVNLNINFPTPFIYDVEKYFIATGSSRTDVLDITLLFENGNRLTADFDYLDNEKGQTLWVSQFDKIKDKDGLNNSVIGISLGFGRAEDTLHKYTLSYNDNAFSSGYYSGFEDGLNDSANNSANFNKGYSQGYNVGKNDGMQSANSYTFLGLIGAVVDAPIQAVSGLLNFELLGFNMLHFFLGLITLALIIAVIRLVL